MTYYNPIEMNAPYILVPGGKYKYSVTGEDVEIPDLYFAKYPVTNKQYRRFVDYLDGKTNIAEFKPLHREKFAQSLLAFAEQQEKEKYVEYLGKDSEEWAQRLNSEEHANKRFNNDDQPVVGVSWYAAMAYCHWLTEMQKANSKEQKKGMIFRLPSEVEWEWVASGGKREYPWGDPEPDETRANYGSKVGHTTPVGAYPAGAIPEGLMDMAGNVWEWMENLYQQDEKWRALRGGAWNDVTVNLRCAARGNFNPGFNFNDVGFRVVRAQ